MNVIDINRRYVWYGMVEVREGAPVAIGGWVLTDRHDLAPCAANSLLCNPVNITGAREHSAADGTVSPHSAADGTVSPHCAGVISLRATIFILLFEQ